MFDLHGVDLAVNRICDVEFEKLNNGKPKGIRAKLRVEAKDFDEAREKARENLLNIVAVLSFTINWGIGIAHSAIVNIIRAEKPVTREKGGKKFVTNSMASFTIMPIPRVQRVHAEEAEKLLEDILKFDEKPRGLMLRAIKWYYRGLLDEDPVDRFVDYWIALESIGYYYVPRMAPTEKVRQTLMKCINQRNTDQLISLRGKLFHSGVEDKATEKLEELESAVRKLICEAVRERAR
jgi:hypothetical protein